MNFDGIIGHEKQKLFLNSLSRSGRIPQSLLFTGIPGVGKKLMAKRFIAGLFCPEPDPPCLRCPSCLRVQQGTHPDYLELSPGDKGNIPIGNEEKREPGSVRWLIDRLNRKAVTGRYGVIVDGADAIAEEGQNALLKTIEEPSPGSVIILIASNRSALLPTIISRSVELKYFPLKEGEISLMIETAVPDHERRDTIALLSGGSPSLAYFLSDPEVLEDLLSAAASFKTVIEKGALLAADIDSLLGRFGPEKLLNALINLYRANVLAPLGAFPAVPPPLSGLFYDDVPTARELVKIFVALKKGQSHNLNFRIALKGMLYSLCSASVNEGVRMRDFP
ncbi:MAG TPA: DNA polymerase III subunit delta' [Spirochaetes bacterium]|nr:DNA polymerase III subunit delta' [Spirochaetota bacterium]